jgi:aminopeptidase N
MNTQLTYCKIIYIYDYFSESGWTKYEFAETEVMSTYLVAFIVSDFVRLNSDAPYSFSAWARPNAIANARYSQTVGPPLVDFYEKYTGIQYKFPKIDQVAVPDFAAGAMENWGLITYRYVYMTFITSYSEVCSAKILHPHISSLRNCNISMFID